MGEPTPLAACIDEVRELLERGRKPVRTRPEIPGQRVATRDNGATSESAPAVSALTGTGGPGPKPTTEESA